MKQIQLRCVTLSLLFGMLLSVSNSSAGGLTRWPVGDVVVHSLGDLKVAVALDRTGDGISEHLLILTMDRALGPQSASGRARIVAKEGQLLFLGPGQTEPDTPTLLPISFTHLAEYGGSQGRVRLEVLERGDFLFGLDPATGMDESIEKGTIINPLDPFNTGGGGGEPCQTSCSSTCNDGSSCSVTGCSGTKCASCSCGSCICVPRT